MRLPELSLFVKDMPSVGRSALPPDSRTTTGKSSLGRFPKNRWSSCKPLLRRRTLTLSRFGLLLAWKSSKILLLLILPEFSKCYFRKRGSRMKTLREKFEEKYHPEPNSGCWIWIAALSSAGYGNMWNGKNNVVAHRFAYETYRGLIPEGLDADHLCRTPCCVNPDHIEPVTRRENLKRGIGIARQRARALTKTHCLRGHDLTEENTYFTLNKVGQKLKVCKPCRRIAWCNRINKGGAA